jgi:sigma-E factor negative regulatory protein RseC
MLTETGRIVAIDEDGVWVETIRSSTCGACSLQKGCGHGLLSRIGEGRRGYIKVLPGALALSDCAVNDRVQISIPEEVILRGSAVVYMVPLLSMLFGAGLVAGIWPGGADLAAMLGAFLGLGAGLALVRWHAWRHRYDCSLQPTLLAVEPRGPGGVAVT